ncbi:MAG: DNA-protecting protein DprA [Acidimicrobiales bacterium]|nr:DNA-protecting protein DprA [Acidimicrobiales bacterium]
MNNHNPLSVLTRNRSSFQATLRLVSLTNLGVSRTRWLLGTHPPELVVECLLRGRLPPHQPPPPVFEVNEMMLEKWRHGLMAQDVDQIMRANQGALVLDAGHDRWPFALDSDPPVLLFVAGDPELLVSGRRVAVVGTRRCSAVGRSVAREIGRTLAQSGVSVVSGLALGIDAAAHQGAGRIATHGGARIGVVASGLDMAYPKRNTALWEEVARTGVLISETPMGERATRWRFPARNRLIAGLSELVVVVESHATGGALITVDEAAIRGIDVAAVPGSVNSPACAGSNELLLDGATPVRNGRDICQMLGLDTPVAGLDKVGQQAMSLEAGTPVPCKPAAPSPVGADAEQTLEQALVSEVAGGPLHLDALVVALDLPVIQLLALVAKLERDGNIVIEGSMIGPAHN